MRTPAYAPKLRDYVHIIIAGWWIILCATALSGFVGWMVWQSGPAAYQSGAQLLVTTPGDATTIDAYYGQLNAALRAPTYLELARSGQVTERTIEQLGLGVTSDELAARISVVPRTQVLIEVTVSGANPEETRKTADAVADNMVGVSKLLANVETGDAEMVKIGAADPARRQGSVTALIVQGAAVGLGLSVLLVIAHGLIRDRLMARSQIARIASEVNSI